MDLRKIRILHIDETFHPSFGYQCNPLAKFQRRAGNEIFIIAPEAKYIYPVYHSFGECGTNLEKEDKEYTNETNVSIIRIHAKGWIMGRLNYNMTELYKSIYSINPDVIMVHCIETLTAMRLMIGLRKKYPLVFDSHMLSIASKNKFSKVFEIIYRSFFTKIIIKEDYTIIKTQDDDYVNTHLGIPANQTKFISFGTDTMMFYPDSLKKTFFLKDNNLNCNSFVIVSTGKLNEQKGGMLLANAVKKRFDNKPVVVVIVANFASEYELNVKKELDNSENTIIYYPVQNYKNLPFFYQIADLTVFPKQCSMSFYDAQSCGSPVVSENINVNKERNSHGNGLCFDPGDYIDFRRKIQTIINLPDNKYIEMRKNSQEYVKQYSYDLIAAQYTDELISAYKRFNKNGKE